MNTTTDRLSLDELGFVLNSVIMFRQKERAAGRKFAERGNIYDKSQFAQDLVSKGLLEKGSIESQWSNFCYYRPKKKAMEEIDVMLEFVNLRMSLNASNA
jgi:hypothetical protein